MTAGEKGRQRPPDIYDIYAVAEGRLNLDKRRRLRQQKTSPLQAARRMYEQTFGRPHDAESINREIEQAFEDWLGEAIPLKIRPEVVLALLLRVGFAGRRPGKRISIYEKISNKRVIQRYKGRRDQIKAELKAKNVPYYAQAAADKAAKEIARLTGLTPATIIEGRPNRRRR